MTEIHPTAAAGFSAAAAAYERGRPGYPDDAVAWLAMRLAITPGRDVLDLAAGTGKLTRQLVPLGPRVVAVEPVAAMRSELQRAVPGIRAVAGTAERIPVDDASVDAITCGQAFHWFDVDRALREMHRVLRPGGGVGLIWNTRDETDALQATISAIIGDRVDDGGERRLRDQLRRSGIFGAPELVTFAHEQMQSREQLLDRIASVSFVAARPAEEQAALLDRVRAAAVGVPEPIRIPYLTEVIAFDRLG